MEILVLDIECANIDPSIEFEVDNDVICDLGIVKLDLDTGGTEVLLGETCKEPQVCHPDSWIFKNSSLTHEEVMKSGAFSSLSPSIQGYFDEYPVTAFNQRYDFPRLLHPSRGLKIPKKFWDPMIVLKLFMKFPQENGIGYKWPRLPQAYEYFHGSNRPHRHRAVEDAFDAADIIYQSVQKWPVLLETWEDLAPRS